MHAIQSRTRNKTQGFKKKHKQTYKEKKREREKTIKLQTTIESNLSFIPTVIYTTNTVWQGIQKEKITQVVGFPYLDCLFHSAFLP